MRRLQSNLAYLAAIADRAHKPSSQIPSHPAIMNAPVLTAKAATPSGVSPPVSEDGGDDNKEYIKELYSQLHALFPGVNPNAQATTSIAAAKAKQQADAKAAADKEIGGEGSAEN